MSFDPSQPSVASIDVEEASWSDTGVLTLRGTFGPGPLPDRIEVFVDKTCVGDADVLRNDRRFGLYRRLILPHPPSEGSNLQLAIAGSPPIVVSLAGRLSASSDLWFADATWTARPDAAASLQSVAATVVVLSTVVPDAPLAHWLPIAGLSAMLRRTGFRTVLLHHGDMQACLRCVRPLLAWFDVVHHQTTLPPLGWDPQSPGTLPPADRALHQTLADIAAQSGAALVIAGSPESLAPLGQLPPDVPRAAVLPRAFARAPSMIFAPVARAKAMTTLQAALAGAVAIVADDGLVLDVQRWLGTRGVVSRAEAAAVAAVAGPLADVRPTTVAVGRLAMQAVTSAVPDGARAVELDATMSLDQVVSILRSAALVVVSPDAGEVGAFAWAFAEAAGLPVLGNTRYPLPSGLEGAVGPGQLTAEVAAWSASPSGGHGGHAPLLDVEAFAAALGLQPGAGRATTDPSKPGLLRAALRARLSGCEDPSRVGLLIDASQPGAGPLAAAFTELTGPGRIFTLDSAPDVMEALPLRQAASRGIKTVLLDVPAGAPGRYAMDRAVGAGVLPVPLAPQASWADHVALDALRGRGRGALAYIGSGPAPADRWLVLALGSGPLLDADVVILATPSDPRRGRLASLFPATDDLFWRRPPAPAVGFDRDPAGRDVSFAAIPPHWDPAAILLAFAVHLNCSKVLVYPGLAVRTGVGDTMTAVRGAGLEVEELSSGASALHVAA